MKIVRVIIYEGSQESLNKQLSQSMPDGTRLMETLSITVATVPPAFVDFALNVMREETKL